MRALLAALLVLGCGGEAATATTSTAAPSGSTATEPPLTPRAAEGPACASSDECRWRHFPVVTTEADCACPDCGGEVVPLALLTAQQARFDEVCGAWARGHDCPPLLCAESHERPLCLDGRCFAEPVVDEEHTGPLPCAHPGDCPGRAACVTAALGGERGCTNETCCGAAECANGCATEADCPSCRPLCREGRCRSLTGAP